MNCCLMIIDQVLHAYITAEAQRRREGTGSHRLEKLIGQHKRSVAVDRLDHQSYLSASAVNPVVRWLIRCQFRKTRITLNAAGMNGNNACSPIKCAFADEVEQSKKHLACINGIQFDIKI